MNDMAHDAKSKSVVDTLRTRFIATALVKLDAIDTAIDGMSGVDRKAHTAEMKLNAHALKGMAGSFGFMSVTRISETFEDYLSASAESVAQAQADARHYNTAMRAIIESGIEPSEAETDDIIGHLPTASSTAID